ncbi:hypothetical protein EVAR_47523_1 [Eumeta japonica]|uniref:Uncharacterized protein n=1 Tax=Eumeta variegata TaxID=151549 RepID=A0A4C1XSJ7_EUMVA|nr:hypothetical protein EVAR_47523_1 [Eumeta japonica]
MKQDRCVETERRCVVPARPYGKYVFHVQKVLADPVVKPPLSVRLPACQRAVSHERTLKGNLLEHRHSRARVARGAGVTRHEKARRHKARETIRPPQFDAAPSARPR